MERETHKEEESGRNDQRDFQYVRTSQLVLQYKLCNLAAAGSPIATDLRAGHSGSPIELVDQDLVRINLDKKYLQSVHFFQYG